MDVLERAHEYNAKEMVFSAASPLKKRRFRRWTRREQSICIKVRCINVRCINVRCINIRSL